MDLRLRSNEARRPFPRKPSGRALATAKIPRRSAPRSFQTGSKAVSWSLRQVTRLSEIGAPTFLHASMIV